MVTFYKTSLVSFFALVLLFPIHLFGQTEESRWGDEKSEAHNLVLTRRANNDDYGTSAFSFRKNTQDAGLHRNYVDLVFNGCHLLHFNPVGGMESRVADLGENEIDVEFDPDKDHVWATKAFLPEEGHVYWQEIKSNGQTMTVRYRIVDLGRDEIKISWKVAQELDGRERSGSMAGTMGQCGGEHASR